MSIKWASLLTFDLPQRAVGVQLMRGGGGGWVAGGGLLWANRAQVNPHISLDSSLHPQYPQSAAEEKMNSLVPDYTISLISDVSIQCPISALSPYGMTWRQ